LQDLIGVQRLIISATSRARQQLLQTACAALHAMLTMLVKHTRRTKCSRTNFESCKRTCNVWTRIHPMCMVLIRSSWPNKAHPGLVPLCRFLRSAMVLTKDRLHQEQEATAMVSRLNPAQCKVLSTAVMDAEHQIPGRASGTRNSASYEEAARLYIVSFLRSMTGSHSSTGSFGRTRTRSLTASSTHGSSTLRSVVPTLTVIGFSKPQTLLFTCSAPARSTHRLEVTHVGQDHARHCVTPFEGYIYNLAPTGRISVRHSEWSYPPRGHVASRCTHTFHLLLSYVSYTGEAGISSADSAFAEERWIEVDLTDEYRYSTRAFRQGSEAYYMFDTRN
jgi:hypothetical protein